MQSNLHSKEITTAQVASVTFGFFNDEEASVAGVVDGMQGAKGLAVRQWRPLTAPGWQWTLHGTPGRGASPWGDPAALLPAAVCCRCRLPPAACCCQLLPSLPFHSLCRCARSASSRSCRPSSLTMSSRRSRGACMTQPLGPWTQKRGECHWPGAGKSVAYKSAHFATWQRSSRLQWSADADRRWQQEAAACICAYRLCSQRAPVPAAA